jgi:hypothetical protein
MDAGEIQALSAMAADSTQRLATTLSTDPAQPQTLDVDVSNLSLELARVEVMRPWLEPLVFENRALRRSDDREPLSNGEEPPSGSLPTYVTAIVFARNLEIELGESPEQNQLIMGQFHAIPLTFLGPLPLTSVSAAATPGSAAVLNSATLAPLSLSQVSSAMVRAVAAGSEEPEGGSDNSLRLPQAPEIPGPEARLAVQTARRQAGSRLSGASSGLWRPAGRICPSTLPCAVRPIAA